MPSAHSLAVFQGLAEDRRLGAGASCASDITPAWSLSQSRGTDGNEGLD